MWYNKLLNWLFKKLWKLNTNAKIFRKKRNDFESLNVCKFVTTCSQKTKKNCVLAIMTTRRLFESTRTTTSYLEVCSFKSHETKRARTSTTRVFSTFSQLSQIFFWRRRDVELKWLKRKCWCKSLLKLKIFKQKRQIWEKQKSVENAKLIICSQKKKMFATK